MNKFTSIIDVGSISGTSATAIEAASSQNESLCPSLSFKNRLIGCAACMALGMLFSILSWVTVFAGDMVSFGVLFTLGNLCSIGSTLFLAGPVHQVKNMFNEGRWIATTVYMVAMVLTILTAVFLQEGILVIILCLFQYGAMWWYFLTYVPFARDAIKATVRNTFH